MRTTFTLFFLFILYYYTQAQSCGVYQVYEGFSAALPVQGGTWAHNSISFSINNPRSGTRDLAFNGTGDYIRTPIIADPDVFSFWYRRSSNNSDRYFVVEISTDNVNWTQIDAFSGQMPATYTQRTYNLSSYSNIYVRIRDTRPSGTIEWYIDDMSWTSRTSSNNKLIAADQTGTSTCSTTINFGDTYVFTDIGGVSDGYSNSLDQTLTFLPSGSGNTIKITFLNLVTEDGYDGMVLYNGNSVSSPTFDSGLPQGADATNCPAGSYYGNLSNFTVQSDDASGAITVRFRSGTSNTDKGWMVSVQCVTMPTCFPPTNLHIITPGTIETEVGWNAPNNPPSVGYEYYYSALNFPPMGPGTPETGTSVLLTGLNANTDYYVWVRSDCGNGDYSDWVGPLHFYTGYCTPGQTGCFNDNITSVNFEYLSDGNQDCNTSYEDRTPFTASPQVIKGQPYTLSVGVGNGGTEYVGVWIDYNQNLVFEASEFTALGSGQNTVVSNTITIDANAVGGLTRMRIRTQRNTPLTAGDACSLTGWGMTRDYGIVIVSPVSNDEPPGAIALTVGGSCPVNYMYNNGFSTVNPNEPAPGCGDSGGDAYHTVWFKFVAPASGDVKITDSYVFNVTDMLQGSRMALYRVTDENDYSTFTNLMCDENSGEYASYSTIYAAGLMPGETYYIQLGGRTSTQKGAFCITVEEMEALHLTDVTNCITTPIRQPNIAIGYTGWMNIVDINGKLVSKFRCPAGTGSDYWLGLVYNNSGFPVRQDANNDYYLDRSWSYLKSASLIGIFDFQFFFTNLELAAFQAVDANALNFTDLYVLHTTQMCPNPVDLTNGLKYYQVNGTGGKKSDYSWLQIKSVNTPAGALDAFYVYASKTPLPVNLISFNAKALNNKYVLLNWKVAEEKGLKEYIVERSVDGYNFEAIGSVTARLSNAYDLIDYRPYPGINYYRLKMVDIDGASRHSEIQQVAFKGKSLISLYPNPTTGYLYLSGMEELRDAAYFSIYNSKGMMVWKEKINGGEESAHNINLSNLVPDLYTFRIISPEISTSLKFIKN